MRRIALALGVAALSSCGDPTPAEPADRATLATLLSSAFGQVAGQAPSPVFMMGMALADLSLLCGPTGKDFGTQRLAFHEVEVMDRKGVTEYTLKARGRCTVDGTSGYRPTSGRFHVVAAPSYVQTKQPTRRDTSSRGYFIWSLKQYALLEADSPAPWVEEPPKPPPAHCPASIAQAASQFKTCNPRNRRICWFEEIGCQCRMMGLPWKCGMGRCPTPRPQVGSSCKDPLVRCLPERDTDASPGGAVLSCVDGRWTEALASP